MYSIVLNCNHCVHSPTAMRPTLVLAKGRDSVKGVGPTPVLHMHRPKGITVLSVRVKLSGSTHFTTPCTGTAQVGHATW
jgi:hypothetical protein